jgi:hypothetical protein
LVPVDLSFGLSIAPFRKKSVPDGHPMMLKCYRETPHCVNARRVRVSDPSVERHNAIASKNAPKPHHQSTHRDEFRECLVEHSALVVLRRRQHWPWLHAESGCHDWRDHTITVRAGPQNAKKQLRFGAGCSSRRTRQDDTKAATLE